MEGWVQLLLRCEKPGDEQSHDIPFTGYALLAAIHKRYPGWILPVVQYYHQPQIRHFTRSAYQPFAHILLMLKDKFFHLLKYSCLYLINGLSGYYFNLRQEIHFQFYGHQVKAFVWRISLATIKNDHGDNGITRRDCETERSIVKGFDGFRRCIPGAFRINTHVQAHIQHFFHFHKTVTSAFFVFPVDEYTSCFVYQTEQRNLRHLSFRNGFISSRNARG